MKSIANGASKTKLSKERAPKPSNTVDMVSKQNGEGDYADILSTGAAEGMRNHTATKLAGHLFAKGISGNEIWSMLKMWNAGKNRPPLDESELHRTFNSVKKLESKNKKKEIEVVQFLDTVDKAAAEYDQQYVRVSFSADLLKNMEAKMKQEKMDKEDKAKAADLGIDLMSYRVRKLIMLLAFDYICHQMRVCL